MYESFERSLDNIGPFLLTLLAAIALLVVGYIVAKVLANLVRKGLRRTRIDNRIADALSRDPRAGVDTADVVAKGVFWIVMLMVVIGFLQVLDLEFVTEPLNRFLTTLFAFIPKLIAAAVLIFVAYVVASLLRFLTQQALHAAGIDERFHREVVTERRTADPDVVVDDPDALAGPARSTRLSVADTLSNVVYYLVWLFFLPAILDTLDLGGALRPVERMVDIILASLPNILAAGIILVLAYVVGRLVAGLVTNLLSSMGFNRMMARAGLGQGDEPRPGRTTPADIAGTFALVAIMLFASMEAANLLGFEALNLLLARLLVFLGQIVLGLIILGLGIYLANLAYRALDDTGGEKAGLLAVVARVAIIVFAGAMALEQMGIADSIINLAFGLTLGAVAVAAAIAFGVGGREFARRQLEELEAGNVGAPHVLKPSPHEPGMERSVAREMDPEDADTGPTPGAYDYTDPDLTDDDDDPTPPPPVY